GSDITYLTVDLLIRGNMMLGNSFGLYGNLGIGIFSPMSSESKALDEASISTTSVVIGGGGIVLPMGTWEIYAGADYYYFPSSEDVSTSVISGKLGVLFAF
ncbi:MAG: hypothetical protein KDD33_13990, partial [Bdellovibrionales bacterium]|nr:hypothetical protein [Bdellovibrionales bacterium]